MAGMIETIRDPILQKIIEQTEAKLDQRLKTDYQRIVVAGMQVLFSNKTHYLLIQHLQDGKKKGNILRAIISGATKLILVVYKQSQGKMNAAAAFPAAITLMCHIFDFVESAHAIKPDPKMVAAAAHLVTLGLLKAFHITQQQLGEGANHLRKMKAAHGDEIDLNKPAPGEEGAPPPPGATMAPAPGGGAPPAPPVAPGV